MGNIAIVGHAYVEIRALTNKFNKDIEKSLQSSLSRSGSKLGKEVGDDFSKEFKKSVDDKLKKSFKIAAPDTAGATEKLRGLGREVDKYDSKTRRATRAVSSFSQSIRRMDDHMLHSLGSIVKFGGGFSGLLMTLDSAGAILGSVIGPLSSLTSGLFALGSAIAPVVKTAGILPGAISAVITPAISATLALSGLGKAYTAGAAAAAGGKEELKKYREALKKLNPQQAEFVEHLLRHKKAIDAVKNAASEKIFEGLSIALDRITRNGFLTILADGLRDAGGALGYVAAQAAALTGRQFFQKSFGRVMDSNVVVIENLGRAFVNLVGYLTIVADAARPFTEAFSEWISVVTGNWIAGAKNNFSGLRSSIGDGVRVAVQLGRVFDNIFTSIGNIGRAARPAGQSLLNAFETATAKFKEWTGQKKNQDRMVEFFHNIEDTTRAIGGLLVSVTREFLKLGENPAFADMINTLAESTVPKLAASMDKLVTVVGDDFIGIFDTIAEIGEIMADSGGLESYLEVMQGFLDVIKAILGIPGFAQFAGNLLAITGAMKALSLVGKFTGLSALATTILPGLNSKKTGIAPTTGKVYGLNTALKALSSTIKPLLLVFAGLELLRTNPLTGTGENPGEGKGSLLPKVPKPLDDFFKSIGDPKSKDKEAIRNWFKMLFEGANIKIPWDDIWEKSRLPEMGRNISRTFSKITGNIADFFRGIPGFVSRMRQRVEKGLGSFRSWVTNIFKTIGRVASNIWNNIVDFLVRTWRTIYRTIAGWVNRVSDNIRRTFNQVRGRIRIIWEAISGFFVRTWRTIYRTVAGWVNRISDNVRRTFNQVRGRIRIIWEAIVGFFVRTWRTIHRTVAGWINRVSDNIRRTFYQVRGRVRIIWNFIKDIISGVARDIYRNTVGRFNDLRASVVRLFNRMRQGVSSAWAKLRAAAREPVEYVVNTVFNNGLRKAFNTINDVIPGVPDIPRIKFGGGSKTGGSRPASDRGFSRGGYTGPGAKYQPAGIVHADEFVIKKESRKRIEQKMPGLLDYMNVAGNLPGFASGGLVAAANWWRKLGARASEHPSFGGVNAGHMKGSLHYSGNAVDLNYGPSGENSIEKGFFDKYIGQFKSKFPSLGVLWRVADHFNHMHIDTGGYSKVGKGGGGGGLPSLGSLLNPIKALTGKLNKGAGKGLVGDLLRGAGKRLFSGAIDLVKNKFSSMAESAGDIVGNIVGKIRGGSAQAQVRAVAATRGWGGGAQWDALNWLVNKESGWNPNAANPTSSARGLFQKMTSIHGPLERSIPGQAKWGLDYIAKRYGNPIKAARFHRSHGYYAGGGRVSPINDAGVFDSGGFLEPGMNLVNNKLGKREHLTRTDQINTSGLVAQYRELTKAIRAAFGASGQMSGAGNQVVSGLVRGMKTGIPGVRDAAVSVSEAAISATQDKLEIHSPSKLFHRFGLNIVQGLVKGVSAGREDLSKALTATITRITDYAEDRIEQYGDNILEGYRRANKRIREYNKTHKNDKDVLTPPTERQAEERAMKRLGYSKEGINRAKNLIKGLGKTTEKIWKGGSSKGTFLLLNRIDAFRKIGDLFKKVSLGDLARGAEVLNSRLASAQEKLKEFKESHRELSESISSGLAGAFSLTSSDVDSVQNIGGINAQAKKLADKAKRLAKKMGQLIKSGMPKAFVQQIAGLGIDEAIIVADAILAGTSTEQKELYKNFNAIGVNTAAVGNVVADQMYQVGISAREGLIKGIEADKKSVDNAAKRLAKRLEIAVRRALGIKSPSTVFARLGEFLPQGLAIGISRELSTAINAVTAMSSAVSDAYVPDFSSGASINSAALANSSRRTGYGEAVGPDGLTDRDRAIIAAIEQIKGDTTMVLNPPPQMDIQTLAKLVSRELEFRRK